MAARSCVASTSRAFTFPCVSIYTPGGVEVATPVPTTCARATPAHATQSRRNANAGRKETDGGRTGAEEARGRLMRTPVMFRRRHCRRWWRQRAGVGAASIQKVGAWPGQFLTIPPAARRRQLVARRRQRPPLGAPLGAALATGPRGRGMIGAMELPVLANEGGESDDPWYAGGLRFTCTQCGNCCTGGPGYVWITTEEVARLAEFLGLTPEQTVERYCRKVGGPVEPEGEARAGRVRLHFPGGAGEPGAGSKGEGRDLPAGGGVPLRRRGCSIYPVRPLQCRTWPFWPENLEDPGGVGPRGPAVPRHEPRTADFHPAADRDATGRTGLAGEPAYFEPPYAGNRARYAGNPKLEIRNPKQGGRTKGKSESGINFSFLFFFDSFPSCFGFRISSFGFPAQRAVSRTAGWA